MSMCTNESLEYCILNDNYRPTDKEIKELAQELWDIKLRLRKEGGLK